MNRLYSFKKNSIYLYSEFLGTYSVKRSVSIFIGLNPIPGGSAVAHSLHTDYWLSKID